MNNNIILKLELEKGSTLESIFKQLAKSHNISVNTTTAEKQIASLGDHVKQAFSGIKSGLMQADLALGGISRIAGIMKSVANSVLAPADQMEQLRLRLVSLYQSTDRANAAFERFRDIATRTPATLQQVVEAGASLKAFGMDAESTLESVSDLAAYMGMDVVEAASAVGRAFAGGAAAADILRERGVLELIKSFKGIDDLTKLTLPEFRTALMESLSDPAAGIAGSADRIAQSYAGAMSNLDDAFTTLRANIGAKLTPLIASFASGLSQTIANLNGMGSATDIASRKAVEQKTTFESLIITYTNLHKKQNRSSTENQIYQSSISSLLQQYPNYFQNIDLEKGKWEDIASAIDLARISLTNYLNLKLREAIMEDSQKAVNKVSLQIMEQTRLMNNLEARLKSTDPKVKAAAEGENLYSGAGFTVAPGQKLMTSMDLYQNKINLLTKEKTALTKVMEERIKVAEKLYSTDIIEPKTTKTPLATGGRGAGGEGEKLTANQAAAAEKQLLNLMANDTAKIEIEYNNRLDLAKVAYAKDADNLKKATNDIDKWKTEQYKELNQKKLTLEMQFAEDLKAAKEQDKADLLTSYHKEIERLANLKTIGALTYDELTGKMKLYANAIKEAFGETSEEYKAALEAMRSAQLRISETLATKWRTDNKVFLDAWSATTSSLVAGFDTAWGSILDTNITGSKRLNLIYDSIKNRFMSNIGDMTSQYIQEKFTQLAVELTVEKSKQAAILQTMAITKSSLISSIAAGLKNAFAGLFQAISNVWQWWTKLLPPWAAVPAALATGGTMIAAFSGIKKNLGFASGGRIIGSGGPTEDNIPIMASNGEFVVNARAVSTPGVLPLLDAINRFQSPALAMASPAQFASGGLVAPYTINTESISELITEVKKLRADVYNAQPTIINHAPNPIEIHKLSETGRKLYKGY